MKKYIITLTFLLSGLLSIAQDISGNWGGHITLPNEKKIQFIFNIEENQGNYKTVVDIRTQRVNNITAMKTTLKNDSLIVDFSNVGMKYFGKLNVSLSEINGKVVEGINAFPLTLSRKSIEKSSGKARPQEPKKPYPYLAEPVSFQNKDDGITLAGTFTRPKAKGKYPVAILISGSGPQDRDETLSGHKPFLVLADHLTRKGIAVLRYDDRGFGESTGVHSEATTYDFATDAISALEYLKTRKDVDKRNIGIIGHSEGGIIAPLVANRTKEVDFFVSLAGTGISGTELSVMQSKEMRPFPVPDEAAYEKAIRTAIKIAQQDKDVFEIKTELTEDYNTTIAPILKNLGVAETKIKEVVTGLVDMRTTKWIRYFYGYNPATEYEKVSCPVLSLNGNLDTQVEAKINQDGLCDALTKGNNNDFKIIELEGINHVFQNAKNRENG
ncbi:alpha/beta hydrolase [Portibacter marinus]|uniref:alpha/beta hydrolase n=1 Tax=Portibacter marinus TaxID=2898660 RepID=UPI001F24ADCB|nr:alpha/beta fold hydrolase [Portibacter marinus]